MSTAQPPYQLELALPVPERGEAPRRSAREAEVIMASPGPESPAVLCQEDAQASCCARDGGRPSGAALQEEASNCHELLRPKAAVVNVMVKRRGGDRVMYGSGRRAQANLR